MKLIQLASTLLGLLIRNRAAFQAAIDRDREHQFRERMTAQYGHASFPTIDLRHLLNSEKVEVKNYTYLGGNSLPTDMVLIRDMAERLNDTVFLEIGSWRGETLSNVAEVARKCISLTLGADDMKALGMSAKFAESHALFLDGFSNIETIHANSFTYDFGQLPEKPNLIFVDGDHTYEGVKNDTEKAFSVLRDDDSVIIWHDYGNNTEDVRHSVMAGIVDGTPAEFRKHLYHVSNTMCAIFIRGDFKTYRAGFPEFPSKTFDVALSIKPFKK